MTEKFPDSTHPVEMPFRTGEVALRELVRRLTDNYFDASFDYGKPDSELQVEYGRVFHSDGRDFREQRRCRNIVIVGAGASFATFGGTRFPLAKDAIRELRDSLGVSALIEALRHADHDTRTGTDRLTEEEERIQLLTRVDFPQADFESQLAIYSQFYTPRQIRAAIHRQYAERFFPHLVFETIAHLLKHRFVDAVINYNFDELLDQAIQDELGGSEYRPILSDGDTADLAEFVIDEQLKVPLYIKPHGTASHKSSLRFTKDDYVGMPSDLQEFTRKILHGQTHEDPDDQREKLQVNLICVGFAFSSIELLYSLRGHRDLSVFHINISDAMKEIATQVRRITPQRPIEQFYLPINPVGASRTGRERDVEKPDVEADPNWTWQSMEAVFRDLPRKMALRFRRLYAPRTLDRHVLVHTLLFREDPPQNDVQDAGARERSWPRGSGIRVPVEDKHYHYARLCIEIAIALAKGNGRIDLTGAMQDRVGTYYKEWREHETGEGRPLRDVCSSEFGLAEHYGFSRTIYALDPEALPSEPERVVNRAATLISERMFEALGKIEDRVFVAHLRELPHDGRETVKTIIQKMVESDLHDVAPTFDRRSLVLITEPRSGLTPIDPRRSVLHTELRLTSEFHEMIRADHWHLMLAISEHGKVLEKLQQALDEVKREARSRNHVLMNEPTIRKRVSLIVADYPENTKVDKRLNDFENGLLLPDAAYKLPFWAHNNHMVIVLRMDFDRGSAVPDRWTPIKAIAYPKPGLSPKVNPILVEEQEDLERLVTMYFGYVKKALPFKPTSDPSPGVPDVHLAEVSKLRDDLLNYWWKRMAEEAGILPEKAGVPAIG